MSMIRTSDAVILKRRPHLLPVIDDFEVTSVRVEALAPGEVLIATRIVSVDPGQRGLMNGASTYLPGMALGDVVSGRAVGTVIESRSSARPVGSTVYHHMGWQSHVRARAEATTVIDPARRPLPEYLSAFGHPGLTAWLGITQVADVQSGDTVFVSSAAGGVGVIAGQIARARGARVIGSVGSQEKADFLTGQAGFDVALNYRDPHFDDLLADSAPNGLDVYFDNVGGHQLDLALRLLSVGGRVAICGRISTYGSNDTYVFQDIERILMSRLVVAGFNVYDNEHRFDEFRQEMGPMLDAGNVRDFHRVARGIEAVPQTFVDLFDHPGHGKSLVQL